MQFNSDFFLRYLQEAPLPLALERTMECNILSKKHFKRPILDVGCGDGIFAKILFGEKIDVGIDPNQLELERARSYEAYDELILCKGDKIPKKDGFFNTIYSNSVMEHIPEIEKVLAEAHRLLSDKGVMYLTLPTNRFDQFTNAYQMLAALGLKRLMKMYRNWFNRFWAHYHCYDSVEWTKTFEHQGFKVTQVCEYASKNICIFNAAATPLSLGSFLIKKLFNRWFLASGLRKYSASILHAFFKTLTFNPIVESGKGGLIFFELVKEKR
ncbi:MAG: class I SAM-dependent methyltransferase [Parachlamydiales bacterium]|nr:class I SAM-dependent methyltransferase [Parachlamydiales bacterium]